MSSVPPLLSFLLMTVSVRVYRHQLIVIEFLQAENRLLKQKLGPKRIRFTDAERALLARKAKAVGRKALLKLDTVVSPDTLRRWHRQLVSRKWNFAHRRGPGRPGIMREISELIVRMAQDNSGWGYTRIQGALANVGHKVGRGTVANVIERHGIEPSPERGKRTRWATFLKAHWKVFAAGRICPSKNFKGNYRVDLISWTSANIPGINAGMESAGFTNDALSELQVRPVERSEEARYQEQMARHHYLGELPKMGETLWYVATWRKHWVAQLSMSSAALKCAVRDRWIGWDFRSQ